MDKENIKISFVIPAYNEEKFIGKCLDSVLAQIQKEKILAEVIVVNNNSIDKTKEIALSFPGVIVIDESKRGSNSARQAGFLKSKGELIANIDADTILTDGWIKKVLEEFEKDKNLVALSGPQIYYDVDKITLLEQKIFYFFAFLSYLFNKYILNIGSLIQGGNFVVKKEALLKVGGFNTQILFWGDDTDTAKRLHKIGNVKFTLKLPIYASGRRLKREGKFKTVGRYVINYFYILFFNKPFHQEIEIKPKSKAQNFYQWLNNKFSYQINENKLKLIKGSALSLLFIILLAMIYIYFQNNYKIQFYKLNNEVKNVFKEIYLKIK
jgi:glycosyltransferase involved in cell wall biosynthesis